MTLPVLGLAFKLDPLVFGLLLAVITPGVHILFAIVLEKRRISFTNDYPAVLFGDPMLATAAALGLSLAGNDLAWPARPSFGILAVVFGLAFGVWQSKREERLGLYQRSQIVSPSKLWHQYVVYPVVGYLVTSATISGFEHANRSWPKAALMLLFIVLWAITAIDALRNPRLGHGGFNWRRLEAVPITWQRS